MSCTSKVKSDIRQVTCKTCGSSFESNRKNAAFCSEKCRYSRKRSEPLPDIPCQRCSTLFSPPSIISRYCGKDCARLIVLEASREATNLKRKIIKCASCPNEFLQRSLRNIYCSEVCGAMGRKENKLRFLASDKGKLSVKPQTKEYKQKHWLKTKYGLSIEQYDVMKTSQNNTCFLCGEAPDIRNLCVDHCHSTGKIRSLLCRAHNTMLGNCSDDVMMLSKAIAYLIFHHPDRFGHIKSFDDIIFNSPWLKR